MTVSRLSKLRKAEQDARQAYMSEWINVHSIPYRLKVGHELARLLAAGTTKKVLLKMLGTTNYSTLNDYLLLIEEPPEDIPEVREEVEVEVADGGYYATVNGLEYERGPEGDWEPKDMSNAEAWRLLDHLPKDEDE